MEDQNMETTTTEEFDFDAFLEADSGSDGNQTDTAGADQAAAEENSDSSPAEPAEGGSSEKAPDSEPAVENPAGDSPAGDSADNAQTFTIKVNKEERTVGREEMISLAQKGADYDRVKEQSQQYLRELEPLRGLKESLQQQAEVLDLMQMISEQTKQPLIQLAENLYFSMQRSQGVDDATARANYRADKLQRQLDAAESQRESVNSEAAAKQTRMQQELQEFKDKYGDILEKIPKEQLDSMSQDIQSGMSFTHAYEKMQAAAQLAEANRKAAELERQLAAEKQNKKNRTASPGSQLDSGGKVKRDAFDDFMDAFI